MRGQGKADGELGCLPIKLARTAVRRGAGYGELRPNKKSVGIRSRFAEELAMKRVELEFAPLWVFAPMNKESASARIVRIGQKAQPVKIRNCISAVGVSLQLLVQVRRMIEGIAKPGVSCGVDTCFNLAQILPRRRRPPFPLVPLIACAPPARS